MITQLKNDSSKIKKQALKSWWFVCDKWFRILEFSFVLGTLYYFSIKTNNFSIKVLYWISWFFAYAWFLELSEYITANFVELNVGKKWLVWILASAFVIFTYSFITETTKTIVSLQFN